MAARVGYLNVYAPTHYTPIRVKTWREPKTIQLLCCMIIVLTATGLVIIVGFISFTQAKLGIVEVIPFGVVISNDFEGFMCAVVVIVMLTPGELGDLLDFQILVGDFVICWRAWVLLPHDKWWRFVLATIVIVNIGNAL
ncbi:hypothetical protein BDP27DRAFT_827245 [Rhodocollybia butyracea]|uniref:Uncharacterized protein n=1 Tax=Rhodocollybia butyracea TaxID=206335 RepID=A0A9P5P7H0_9AGAR|nr:hypothetical protein BDP27DRAFT_827245 [Rhodocollybia butyracea]